MGSWPKLNFLFVLSGLVLFITSCAYLSTEAQATRRAQQAYSARDYDAAVKASVTALLADPGYDEALDIIDSAFPRAVDAHRQKIINYSGSNEPDKFDRIVREYEALQSLVDRVNVLDIPQREIWLFKAKVEDYQSLLNSARQSAAEDHYLRAEKLLAGSNRDDFRLAAEEFKLAVSMVAGYRDAQARYEDARRQAITRMAIVPIRNTSGQKEYGDLGAALTNQIMSRLLADRSLSEFFEVVSRDQMDMILDEQDLAHSGLVDSSVPVELGQIMGAHLLLTGQITQIEVTDPQHIKNKRKVERDVIVGQETTQDSEGKKHSRTVFDRVSARVTFHELHMDATMMVTYRIVDVATARVLTSNTQASTEHYRYEWATYTGDKRALDWNTKALVQKKEQPPPPPTELMLTALEDLTEAIVRDVITVLE